MQSFRDNEGRMWLVAVDVAAVKRARALAGFDLVGVLDRRDDIDRLARDPVMLVDVLYAVCKPEADARGVSDEAFGTAMAGDALEHAAQALIEAIVSFSPNPRVRAIHMMALEKARAAQARALDALERGLEERIEAQIESALSRLGDPSGSSQESSV
jgi:hypothetical protein